MYGDPGKKERKSLFSRRGFLSGQKQRRGEPRHGTQCMYTCLANLESASLVRGQVQSCAMSTPVVFCLTVKYKSHAWRDVKRCRVGSQVVVLASLGVPHAGKRRGRDLRVMDCIHCTEPSGCSRDSLWTMTLAQGSRPESPWVGGAIIAKSRRNCNHKLGNWLTATSVHPCSPEYAVCEECAYFLANFRTADHFGHELINATNSTNHGIIHASSLALSRRVAFRPSAQDALSARNTRQDRPTGNPMDRCRC